MLLFRRLQLQRSKVIYHFDTLTRLAKEFKISYVANVKVNTVLNFNLKYFFLVINSVSLIKYLFRPGGANYSQVRYQ